MEVSCEPHVAVALFAAKNLPIPAEEETGRTSQRTEKILPMSRFDSRLSTPQFSHYTTCGVLAADRYLNSKISVSVLNAIPLSRDPLSAICSFEASLTVVPKPHTETTTKKKLTTFKPFTTSALKQTLNSQKHFYDADILHYFATDVNPNHVTVTADGKYTLESFKYVISHPRRIPVLVSHVVCYT
jgi:hypothetical protein